jgi:hypothetical protein
MSSAVVRKAGRDMGLVEFANVGIAGSAVKSNP